MDRSQKRYIDRKKRAVRIRRKVFGTTEQPRLSIRRSLRHISAQLIDDTTGTSIAQVASSSKEVASQLNGSEGKSKSDIAKIVGELIAGKAVEKGVKQVVFDRKGYKYHGRVKALADAARAKGLQF
jgi:large subunit ribosomal protein L18